MTLMVFSPGICYFKPDVFALTFSELVILTPFDIGFFRIVGHGGDGAPPYLNCCCSDDQEIWHRYQA